MGDPLTLSNLQSYLDIIKYNNMKAMITTSGLDSHIAVLCDGRVVPCCLDYEAIIELGNLHNRSLDEILEQKRVKDIRDGFTCGEAVEELCQRCSYKSRFEK